MNVILVFNPEAAVANAGPDAECMAIVHEADLHDVVVAEAGPAVIDRLRKAANGGRHEGLKLWVVVDGRMLDAAEPAAEVLLLLKGCLLHENEVKHDWFGKEV